MEIREIEERLVMTNIELMKYWIESSDTDYNTMLYMKDVNKNTWALFIGH